MRENASYMTIYDSMATFVMHWFKSFLFKFELGVLSHYRAWLETWSQSLNLAALKSDLEMFWEPAINPTPSLTWHLLETGKPAKFELRIPSLTWDVLGIGLWVFPDQLYLHCFPNRLRPFLPKNCVPEQNDAWAKIAFWKVLFLKM